MDWTEERECRGLSGTEVDRIFFGAIGVPPVEAREICGRCPVKQECLDHAISTHERYGVWGGLTEKERRQYARFIRTGRRMIPVGVQTENHFVSKTSAQIVWRAAENQELSA